MAPIKCPRIAKGRIQKSAVKIRRIILLLFIFSFMVSLSESHPQNKVELSADESKLITDMQNQRYLKIHPELNRVQIDPLFWAKMPYDSKSRLAVLLAVYCGNRDKSSAYWVEIYDMYSGKKLAKHSPFGFTVY